MYTTHPIIIRPLVTEKSMRDQGLGKYVFLVSQDATKITIRKTVEALYGAQVASVQVSSIRAKTRAINKRAVPHTKRREGKKAIVTIKKGTTLDTAKLDGKYKPLFTSK